MKTAHLVHTGPAAPSLYTNALGAIFQVTACTVYDPVPGTPSWWQALKDHPADFVIFLDHRAGLSPEKVAEYVREIKEAGPAGMFYPADEIFTGARAGYLPVPYFSIIPCALLLNGENELREYRTLEYVLMHLGLQPVTVPSLLLSPAPDTVSWLSTRLRESIAEYAGDYLRLQELLREEKAAQLPPQFRISTADREIRFSPGEVHSGETEFSILCPVFKPDFLEEMIASVQQQTYRNWELIMGVDGPPEQDRKRIRKILQRHTADRRIRYFEQDNRGTGPTRERLRRLATGSHILAIDDDDKLIPLTLEVFAKAIRDNPGIPVFRGGSRIFGLAEQELLPRPRYRIGKLSNDPFEVNQPYVIEAGLLDDLGGYRWDTSLRNAGEDTYLFHQLDNREIPAGLIKLPLYMRRLSTRNLTLEFEGEEAMAHFDNIHHYFGDKDWDVSNRAFDFEGNFQLYTATYRNSRQPGQLVTATRFFQYQTLGNLNQLTIDLEVTAKCNAVCGFCPRDVMPDKKTNISLETVRKLADYIRQFPGTQVVLCGIGESLLHPQLLEIVHILKEAGAVVAMTSNGALMKPEKFKMLIEAGLTNFNFSVNAYSAEVHREVMGMKNFEKVMENVRWALQYKNEFLPGVRVHISCVVCDKNEHEVHDFVRFWKEKGASQVWLHPLNNRAGLLGADLKSAMLDKYAEHYQGDPQVSVDIFKDHEEGEHLCKIAKSLAFISSDGEMRLCAMDYRRKTSHGNIRHKTMQQMQFEKLKKFLRGDYDEFCHGCDFCPPGIEKQREKVLEEL